MPKKFKGENSKATEARAKKSAAKAEADAAKQKAQEDEYWRDDDKHVQRKLQRKDDKEKKRSEQLERKKEKEALLEEEMSSIKSAKPTAPTKVTRADIEKNKQKAAATAAKPKGAEDDDNDGPPLEENVNRMMVEGDEARTVTDAISVLSVKGGPAVDQHPEKRMKAAFKAYEDKNLPLLKAENPNMRLSQIKQLLKKDWMKSPDNPMVQHQLQLRENRS